jgi:hypothetical protein
MMTQKSRHKEKSKFKERDNNKRRLKRKSNLVIPKENKEVKEVVVLISHVRRLVKEEGGEVINSEVKVNQGNSSKIREVMQLLKRQKIFTASPADLN